MDATLSLDIATLVVTAFTGVALAVFAWWTYRLSKNITQRRYSPVLELYSIGSPEAGSFEQSGTRYHGVKWQISLVNPGDVPIWVDNIDLSMQVTQRYDSEEEVWTGVGGLCDLLDDQGNILVDRAIGVNGNSQRKITVFLCHEDKRPEQHKLFKPGDVTTMRIELLQRGRGDRPTGWLMERSDKFRLPEKFSKEPIAHLV